MTEAHGTNWKLLKKGVMKYSGINDKKTLNSSIPLTFKSYTLWGLKNYLDSLLITWLKIIMYNRRFDFIEIS